MALPEGVTTATVIAGVPVTHTGAPVKAFVSIEPSAYLVHAATGTPLVDFIEELDISEGTAGQFILPHTDQAGFIDASGNAYTNWYYTARVTYSTPSKAKTKAPKVKVFQLTTGQTTVDLDLLPAGAPALPYIAPTATVTAFQGRTGPVTLLESDLPARLTDEALSATFGRKPELVNPAGLNRWRKAVGEALFNRTAIIAQGDSITDGAWANGTAATTAADKERWAKGGFVGQLRTLLSKTYGYAGEGYINFPVEETRWTLTNTVGLTATAVASTGMRFASEGTAQITPEATTSVDTIGYLHSAGGALRTLIDGVDKTPTNLTAAQDALTGGWTGLTSTIAYGAGPVMTVTSTAATAGYASAHTGINTNGQAVTPGKYILVQAEARPDTVARDFTVSIIFYTSGGAQVGSEIWSTARVTTVGQWKQASKIAKVPDTAAYATTMIRFAGTLSGEAFTVRNVKSTILTRYNAGKAGAEFYRYNVPTTDAQHTIKLVAGAGVETDSVGVMLNSDPAAKVMVHNSGRSGSSTRGHAAPYLSADGQENQFIGTYEAVDTASLVIIALGANDYNRQDTEGGPTTYRSQLQTLANRAVLAGASVLLVAGPRWEDDTKPYNQDAFYAEARAIAETTAHVSFFDLKEVWGDYAASNAKGFMYDSPHPNLAGHGDYARVLLSVLNRPYEVAA